VFLSFGVTRSFFYKKNYVLLPMTSYTVTRVHSIAAVLLLASVGLSRKTLKRSK